MDSQMYGVHVQRNARSLDVCADVHRVQPGLLSDAQARPEWDAAARLYVSAGEWLGDAEYDRLDRWGRSRGRRDRVHRELSLVATSRCVGGRQSVGCRLARVECFLTTTVLQLSQHSRGPGPVGALGSDSGCAGRARTEYEGT